MATTLPLPPHFDPSAAGSVWRVAYRERVPDAEAWAQEHDIGPAESDGHRVCLLLVDCQNTFCIPEFELFVGGRSGTGAVDDTARIAGLVYRTLGAITEIVLTLDTHTAVQIFHPFFWIDQAGRHPEGGATIITSDDLRARRWRVNPAAAAVLGYTPPALARHALYYVERLEEIGRYPLMAWPYHAMLGGIGHSLVSAIEEAAFFHGIARRTAPRLVVKGQSPLTEHYSVFGPEVLENADNLPLGQRDHALIEHLLSFDVVLLAGQAKSHCVAWTVEDLLRDVRLRDTSLASKVHLLEDCSSPVVIPGVVDFTDQADAAFARFAEAGMRVLGSHHVPELLCAPAGS